MATGVSEDDKSLNNGFTIGGPQPAKPTGAIAV
jgi:hypothetical protein